MQVVPNNTLPISTGELEKDLEQKLINTLQSLGYEYLPNVKDEGSLRRNLRLQLEKLNSKDEGEGRFKFTDTEWYQFYTEHFKGNLNEGVENRTKRIHGDGYIRLLTRDDGSHENISLIDKKHLHKNRLQVINQYSDIGRDSRYDVTILVNGLPLIHIELKKRGISLKDAFQQINNYKKASFRDLYEYVQIFIISNGTHTKYYSNTVEYNKSKNSFLFTSWWSSKNNEHKKDLFEFTKSFLEKGRILEILVNYCVLDSSGNLKVLRPYQIYAIEEIIGRIKLSINSNIPKEKWGGYIWHTTGSGKTLTSFKAAILAKEIPEVKKVMFVVDRKDLDNQTHLEYKKFLGDCSEQVIDRTNSTNALKELINDNQKRVIITTIQKLRRLLEKQLETKDQIRPEITNERIVIIMDECHRSQTTDIHFLIEKVFPKKNLFGFTGTPLINKGDRSTTDIFGDELHSYKIIDAINDKNVLPFWRNGVGMRGEWADKISMNNATRMEHIVSYILDNYDTKTNPKVMGEPDWTKRNQFNSIFAVESIEMAIAYYREFERQLEKIGRDLRIAVIYSANNDIGKEEERDDKKDDDLSPDHKHFLYEVAMKKYAEQQGKQRMSYNEYHFSISSGMKNNEIDILIVVNMFLTGFDASCLNTIWIDKYLSEHNLIQAFSRTNRILNDGKRHGNIVYFRDIDKEIDDSLICFAGGDCVFIKSFEERLPGFQKLEDRLINEFPVSEEIIGKSREKEFVQLFNEYLREAKSLCCDERFEEVRKISPDHVKDYQAKKLEIFEKHRDNVKEPGLVQENKLGEEESDDYLSDPIIFDLELLRSDEIGIDYIIELLSRYWQNKNRDEIIRLINTSPELRKQKYIIVGFLDKVDKDEDGGHDLSFREYKEEIKEQEIEKFINKYKSPPEGTRKFINGACEESSGVNFRNKSLSLMPPINAVKEPERFLEVWNNMKSDILEIYEIFKN